jgi:hypothetical protein
LYESLFKYHGDCFDRYDTDECKANWTAFEQEQQRVTRLYGPEPRWWGFPDALKGRVFTSIPHKHVGEEAAKQWVRIPGTDMEAYVKQRPSFATRLPLLEQSQRLFHYLPFRSAATTIQRSQLTQCSCSIKNRSDHTKSSRSSELRGDSGHL